MAHLTGAIGYPQQTSEVVVYSSTAPSKIPLGTRARDAAGNEFVYVDFDAAKAVGEIVTFNTSYLATACGATTTGMIGVVCGEASSSDKAGWVQIYGVNSATLAGSAITSGWAQVGATTDGYSVPAQSGSTGMTYSIRGFQITAAPSTATSPGYATTASSILGVTTVLLNYPYVQPDIATS